MNVYLVGSLRRNVVRELEKALRDTGYEVFAQWHAGGPTADAEWRAYFEEMGASYPEALYSPFVQNIRDFDSRWMQWADVIVLVLPAGIDAHIELAWCVGHWGKAGVVYAPEGYERWGAMIGLAEPRFAETFQELRSELDDLEQTL